VTGVYDDEAATSDDYEPMPVRRRRGGRVLTVLLVLVVMGLIGAGLAGIWYQRQVHPSGAPGPAVAVKIPPGSSTQQIAAILATTGVIKSPQAFRVYVKLKGAANFQAGDYTLHRPDDFDVIIKALKKGPEYVFTGKFLTIPEGFTLAQIAERVGKIPGRTSAAFLAAAQSGTVRSQYEPAGSNNLEGLLYPDTYQVEKTDDETAILRKMVTAFDAAATAAGVDQAQAKVGVSPYEAIIIASLVEREGKVPQDRGKISRVIHNRLAQHIKLQIDATVLYALGSHKTVVLFKDLEVDSPYNTYKIPGLPPGPIASPGRASLEAAVNPEPGDWIFYVKCQATGEHCFSNNQTQFNRDLHDAHQRGVTS
jgi:UPF0755 protein